MTTNNFQDSNSIEKKYNFWIVFLSILIPVAVAILLSVRLKDFGFIPTPMHFLPPIYATINGLTAIILIIAVIAIKNGNRKLHENLMKTAIAFSVAFLLLYIAYHLTTDATKYGGKGVSRIIYFILLISHISLSIVTIPLVLVSYVRALAKKFDKHKKLTRYTFPIWLYVAVTGVIVYLMISPYYAT
jgi:putative membrane protein